jgi:hypothetical protein
MTSRASTFAVAFILAVILGCAGSQKNIYDTTWDGWQSLFIVPAADWSSRGTNAYFPLEPGAAWDYVGSGGSRMRVAVLDETKVVDGVTTRVVTETETVDGTTKAVYRNYLAITRSKDIYYFGMEADIAHDGAPPTHEGSWLAGVNGATFGLFLPGAIDVGARFYQQHAPGVAMDRYVIRSKDKTVEVPAGWFEHCLDFEETTPLDAKRTDHLYFAPGVGLIQYGAFRLATMPSPHTTAR